jgi:hypothetical protein
MAEMADSDVACDVAGEAPLSPECSVAIIIIMRTTHHNNTQCIIIEPMQIISYLNNLTVSNIHSSRPLKDPSQTQPSCYSPLLYFSALVLTLNPEAWLA